ncbi:hypothetical protein E2562_010125 [Oryza meyeriana var. granulata]|uniref:DUF834 domain-containing protein n=1 Tax=Oryza meyeriana var. granulata TaxID=110450 RepID=A0A6G1EIQ5_9ORYZ|nr:hypothetical protein E2562_010125 [Oryza meyeriana var. granulata]
MDAVELLVGSRGASRAELGDGSKGVSIHRATACSGLGGGTSHRRVGMACDWWWRAVLQLTLPGGGSDRQMAGGSPERYGGMKGKRKRS